MLDLIHSNLRRQDLFLAALCSSINKLLITLPEFFLGVAIDVVLHERKAYLIPWGFTTNAHQLLFFAGCVASIWICSSVFYFLEIRYWQICAQMLQHNLRVTLYTHVSTIDLDAENTGNLVAIINDDVNNIEQFLRFSAHDTIHLIIGTAVIAGTYCYYCPFVALAAVVPLPIVLSLSFTFHRRLQFNYVMLRNQAGKLATQITHALTKKTFDLRSLEQESLAYQRTALEAAQTNALFNPSICLALGIGIIGTLVVSGWYTLHGTLSTGMFSIIFLQTQRLLWPFARLPQLIDAYESTMASLQRVNALFKKAPRQTPPMHLPEQQPLNETISR